MTHISINELSHRWFRQLFCACSAPSHQRNQWWHCLLKYREVNRTKFKPKPRAIYIEFIMFITIYIFAWLHGVCVGSFGMDKSFNNNLYNGYNYLFMVGLEIDHVSKRGPWKCLIRRCHSSRQPLLGISWHEKKYLLILATLDATELIG